MYTPPCWPKNSGMKPEERRWNSTGKGPTDLPPSTERSLEFMRAAGVEPTLRWSSNNLATVASLVGAGLGWSLRYTLPGEQPAARGLVEIPVADPTPPNAVCAVVPDGDRVDQRVRHALEVLRRVLSEEEGRPDVDCA